MLIFTLNLKDIEEVEGAGTVSLCQSSVKHSFFSWT